MEIVPSQVATQYRVPLDQLLKIIREVYRLKAVKLATLFAAAGATFILWKLGSYKKEVNRKPFFVSANQPTPPDVLNSCPYPILIQRSRKIIRICYPSYKSTEFLYLFALTCLLFMRTYLTISIANCIGLNAKYLVENKFIPFVKRMFVLFALAVPASIVNSALKYCTERLALFHRERLTLFVHKKYMTNRAYYLASILRAHKRGNLENIEQRMMIDIEKLSMAMPTVYANVVKPVCDLCVFSSMLSRDIGWKGPVLMLIYYFFAGICLRSLMPAFNSLIQSQVALEKDIHLGHAKLVERAEDVALNNGEDRERESLDNLFQRWCRHTIGLIQRQAVVDIADEYLVKYGATIMGFLVVSFEVFGSESLKKRSPGSHAYTYVRDSHLLMGFAKAIGQLVLSFKRVATASLFVHRVSDVITSLEKLNAEGKISLLQEQFVNRNRQEENPPKTLHGDMISFDRVDILSNSGHFLVRELTFDILPGTNLVISGNDELAKSNIVRLLAGLIPLSCGTLTKPPSSDLLFVTKNPYFCLGTLRDQIIYPHTSDQMSRRGYNDHDLFKILEMLKLNHLITQNESWNTVRHWDPILSPEEKQLLSLARVFYNKPRFAVFQDCTSSIHADMEELIYDHCRSLGITIISFVEKRSLWKKHQMLLLLDGSGGFHLHTLESDSLDSNSNTYNFRVNDESIDVDPSKRVSAFPVTPTRKEDS